MTRHRTTHQGRHLLSCVTKFLLVGLCSFIVAPRAGAEGTLGEAISDLAQDVRKILTVEGKNKITMGQFPGRGDIANHSSAGPLVSEALRHRLLELKVEIVERKGDFELTGEYEAVEDTISGRQFVHISLELRDRLGGAKKISGRIDGKISKYYVKNEPDLAKLIGVTVYLPPEKTDRQRLEDIKKQVDNPKSYLQGTRILAGDGAPYALEILVAPPSSVKHEANDYKERDPQDREGLAFVPIRRDEVYGVRLLNDADHDVAVDLRIDGLSMYHFSEKRDAKGLPLFRYVIVRNKSSVVIRGWYVSLNDSDEFLVTEYAKSAVGKIGSSASVGTITANFHAAWPRGTNPPPGEKRKPGDYSLSSDATGQGQRFQEKYEVVDYTIGALRAPISVRYSKIGKAD